MIAPLPPPVHGSAVMTQYIKDSQAINKHVKMDWINLSTSRGMNEIGHFSVKKVFRFASSYVTAIWKLMTTRYDSCYIAITCHGIPFLKDLPFVLMCKMFGRKIILHQHNKGMSSDVGRLPYRLLFPLAYSNAKVILLSWRLYGDIEKVVNREQVVICPNGIPCVKTRSHKETNPVPQLLFLSNLLESKGVYVLLDACEILHQAGYEFTCVFVGGETSEISSVKLKAEICRRGLQKMVSYLGCKYGDEKDAILETSDIFVFPTLNECFGLVLVEAMAHGCAVIATDEGGIPDIVDDGQCGLIVKKGDASDLADKIKRLLDNPDYCRLLGERGRERANKNFSLRKFEEQMVSILTQG